jgi:hypothetical protein
VNHTRVLAGAVVAAALASTALPALAVTSSSAATSGAPGAVSVRAGWGPYFAPGGKAKAVGKLRITGVDRHAVIPVGTATVSGKVSDLSPGSSCGLAVFRITYQKADGSLPFKHRAYWACKGKVRNFRFTDRKVNEVELKVCGEGRAAKPSATCLYAGAWKILYVGRPR